MKWWQKDIAITAVVLPVYLFCFGPAERFAMDRENGTSRPTLVPTVVMIVYLPVDVVTALCPPFDRFMDWYLGKWGVLMQGSEDTDPNPGN